MIRKFLSRGAVCAVFLLPGCSGLVPSTLAQMAGLDPFSADPAGFAVAVEAAGGVAPAEGSARLTWTATHSPRGDVRRLSVPLREDRRQAGRIVYALSPQEAEALRGFQREIRGWTDSSDGNSTLVMTVQAEGCRTGAELAEEPRVTVHVSLAPGAPMRPLLRDAPALPFFRAEHARDLPPCAGIH